jgi:hypothetical protein
MNLTFYKYNIFFRNYGIIPVDIKNIVPKTIQNEKNKVPIMNKK